MSITAKDVNELRKKTGAGMMDCKKALTESNGDMESAIDFLRKKVKKLQQKEEIEMLEKVWLFLNQIMKMDIWYV